jgi:hypothetical protein
LQGVSRLPKHSDIADNPAMPWKATNAMKERVKFVLEGEEHWNEAQGGGPADVADLRRKYGVSRTAGHAWVKEYEWPSTSSIGSILERRGLRFKNLACRSSASRSSASSPPAENLMLPRRALDEWRREDNDQRPHEALGDVDKRATSAGTNTDSLPPELSLEKSSNSNARASGHGISASQVSSLTKV